jgi:hypothetical protein
MAKIRQLEELASEVIGDNGSPNLYFVTEAGRGVILVSREFDVAYDHWRHMPRSIETSLEDRKIGTICSTTPYEDGSTTLVTYDDSHMVKR